MNMFAWVLVIVVHTHGGGPTVDPSDGVSVGVVPFATKAECLAQRPGIIRMVSMDGQDQGIQAMCVPTGFPETQY